MWRLINRLFNRKNRSYFSLKTADILRLSQEVAASYQNNYVGTQHILTAFVTIEDSVATQVLHKLGVNLTNLQDYMEIDSGINPNRPKELAYLTEEAKQAIRLAVREARIAEKTRISSGLLLLGIIREGNSVACQVLADMGVTYENAHREVMSISDDSEDVPEVPTKKK